jgi:galacturan 1,4-alpha-galacturonidase
MALFKHFLFSFTIIIISFVACNSNLQEDPLITTYVDHSPSNDGGDTLLFKNFIYQNTNNILSLDKFDDATSRSLEIVNVNDYGAKGNGYTDDTQVYFLRPIL